MLKQQGEFIEDEKLIDNFCIKSRKLGTKGSIDCLFISNKKVISIEIKFSKYPLMYKLQLVGYITLLKSSYDNVSYGYFIYKHSGKIIKINKYIPTQLDIINLNLTIKQIKKNFKSMVRPKPTNNTEKCFFCEYKNFCNDII